MIDVTLRNDAVDENLYAYIKSTAKLVGRLIGEKHDVVLLLSFGKKRTTIFSKSWYVNSNKLALTFVTVVLYLLVPSIHTGLPPLPSMFSPAIYGRSFVDDVGNGQQSSYSERTYTLPGYLSYYERIG